MIFLERFFVDSRPVIKAFEIAEGGKLDEILVALNVFGQKYEMKRSLPNPVGRFIKSGLGCNKGMHPMTATVSSLAAVALLARDKNAIRRDEFLETVHALRGLLRVRHAHMSAPLAQEELNFEDMIQFLVSSDLVRELKDARGPEPIRSRRCERSPLQ